MKVSEARKLIGKRIEWMDTFCPWRGGFVRTGTLRDVKGRNVLVERQGSDDWLWLPNMRDLRELKPATDKEQG